MNRSLSPWIRLVGFTGGMIGTASIAALLRWHFGFPIAHYRAMPTGTPLWWSLVLGASAAVLVVLWLLAARSAMDLIREWSIVEARVEQWWTKAGNNTFRTGGMPPSRAVLLMLLVFVGLPLGCWVTVVWIMSRCWLSNGTTCWSAIALSASAGAVSLIVIHTALARRLATGQAFRPPVARTMFTLGAAMCVLLLAPVLFTELVLILGVVLPLGAWLER